MSVRLQIGEGRSVPLDLSRGCRRNAHGGLSMDGRPLRYRAVLDETRREGAKFPDCPCIVAEVETIHEHGCAATRMGKKYGPCDCGGDAMWRRFVEAAGDPWELAEGEAERSAAAGGGA